MSSSVSIKVPDRSTGCGRPGCRSGRADGGSIKVPDRSTGSPGFRGSDMIRTLATKGGTIAVFGTSSSGS